MMTRDMAIQTVDARGLSCPQPVIMSRAAIKRAGTGAIEVLVDTGTSRDNVTRMARKEGWQVEVQQAQDGFKLILNK
jgi:tRNA 2-thiouridine synthesizing protein A